MKYYFNEGVRCMLEAQALPCPHTVKQVYELMEEAVSFYDAALELEPRNATVVSAKGYSLKQLGKTLEAAELFEAAIELEPGFSENYYQLSLCFFEGGMFQHGFEVFNEALEVALDKPVLEKRVCSELVELSRRYCFCADEFFEIRDFEQSHGASMAALDILNIAVLISPDDQELLRMRLRVKTVVGAKTH